MFEYVKPINPKTERLKKQLLIAVPVAAVLIGCLYYEFKNYPEEQQVSRFLAALQREDYQGAYQIWQPSKFYKFKDFSQDWGPQGVNGPVHKFGIMGSHARGSGVEVDARINDKEDVSIWVERRDKSLSFPP